MKVSCFCWFMSQPLASPDTFLEITQFGYVLSLKHFLASRKKHLTHDRIIIFGKHARLLFFQKLRQ